MFHKESQKQTQHKESLHKKPLHKKPLHEKHSTGGRSDTSQAHAGSLFRKNRLSSAVASVVTGVIATGGATGWMPVLAQNVLEEVVVTASKQSSNIQDIAITVQAMTYKDLEALNVDRFEDYVHFLPSVHSGGRGPGQNEIYIRGAAVDAINITVAESQGSAPNVALYLDEHPVTAGGRNLDVYVADMERIEVLPGPQGTLYGASSQAGTVRLITRKPQIDEFSASFAADYSTTANGEDSNSAEAVLNIPLIAGTTAFRALIYSDDRGGYIDNVPGTFTADHNINPTFPGETKTYDAGTVFANGDVVGPDGLEVPVVKQAADNGVLVEDDYNDASYKGMRLGISHRFNDDWSGLLQYSQQSLRTDGVFDVDESLGDLEVSRYVEDFLEDDFTQIAWTIEGRIGALEMVYTGAYLDREVDANIDYTGYTNIGKYIAGYQCEYLSTLPPDNADVTTRYNSDPTIGGDPRVIECGNPANGARMNNENSRFTSELRFSGDLGERARFLAGVYYEDSEILHIGDFNYQASFEAGWNPIDINLNPDLANADANARGLVTSSTQFRNDNRRTEEQVAWFGEVSFDLTESFTVALSARYYDLEYGFTGYGAWRYYNRPLFVDDADPMNDVRPNATGGRDYETNFADLQPLDISDTITKATLTYRPNDNWLFYATVSEGYRPPGFNRAAAQKGGEYDPTANNMNNEGMECGTSVAINSNAATGFPGYCLPYVFESDTLDNYELSWKATLMDGQMRFNGSVYQIDWDDIQVSQFDSQNISILTLIDNGGDAEIQGVEFDLTWAATDNLTISAAASYNDTELVKVDPGFAVVVQDEGNPLPLSPKIQFNMRFRYEWEMSGGLGAYWQLAGKYSDKALNSIVDTPSEPNSYQDSYTTLSGAVGVQSDEGWSLELYGQNLTDERAQIHINRQDFFERVTINRPRTIGLRLSYDLNK